MTSDYEPQSDSSLPTFNYSFHLTQAHIRNFFLTPPYWKSDSLATSSNMEEIGTDERKPFEHEDAIKDEEETQPEPDEQLMMDQGSGRVWSVKVLSMRICLLETGVDIPSRVQVPKHLMEAWSARACTTVSRFLL